MSVHERDERFNFKVMQCALCRHLDTTQDDLICPAYPDGIPPVVYTNKLKHDKVLPGQVGTTIFRAKGKKPS
jgi:hypothetical protein